MKFIHLSDLHIGKRVNEFLMLEEQKYILSSVLDIIAQNKLDAVVIAGDVYDKSVPSTEAVTLFDEFLYKLWEKNLQVFVISGNHDSPERIAFASRLMGMAKIYISPVYNGDVKPITLTDKHGSINFYLLPFIKPAHVKRYFPEEEIASYTDAMKLAINQMNINPEERNVILTHQFVTGAVRSDSEDISVGGSDNVDVCVFDNFDYVALGHLHKAQQVSRNTVRYCGTLLKYSLAEASHEKTVTLVDIGKKGDVQVEIVPIKPRLDLRVVKGIFAEISDKTYYSSSNKDDFLHIVLTDELENSNHLASLRAIYPNIMKLEYDNARTRAINQLTTLKEVEHVLPIDVFSEFYREQNNVPLSEEQKNFVSELIEELWGEEQ